MSQPTDPELAILKALWSSSPMAARAIHERAGVARGWSLSSTRTTLTRMVAKGLLAESKAHGVTVFRPVQAKTATLAGLMRDFLGRVLELRGPLPTAAFAQSELLDEAELAELRALLDASPNDADPSDAAPSDEPEGESE